MAASLEVSLSPALIANLDLVICPVCGGHLKIELEHPFRLSCGKGFQCEEGIPLLFWPNDWVHTRPDVTETIKAFYETCPFPNYDDLDSSGSLREKARAGIFARLLDEQVPHQARILEVGCGTGQLSNFLGLTWERTVFGTDICLNSLKLGQSFRVNNGIGRVAFLQMNLFRPVFKPAHFDLVICNGVLHHTSNPAKGFEAIAKLVTVGGFIVVGLYNTYGRLATDVRRMIYRLSGGRGQFLDPRLRDKTLSSLRKKTWFADQYRNPHESKHTIGEVLGWFDRSGIEFMSGIPNPVAVELFSANERLFEKHPRGGRWDHFLVQLDLMLSGGREGGFFLLIGRKTAEEGDDQ